MLENKKEELACMHVLGMLPDSEEAAFVATLDSDPAAARTVREFTESLTNLHLSTTPVQTAPDGSKGRLFERIAREPARVSTDASGHILAINPSFTEMCGYRLQDLIGKKPGHVLQGPGTAPESVKKLRDAVNSGLSCEVEMLNYHKNGTPYWVHIQLDPTRDAAGMITGYEAAEKKLPMPAEISNT